MRKKNALAKALVEVQIPRCPPPWPFFGADRRWHVCLIVDRGGNTPFKLYRALTSSYLTVQRIIEAEENTTCCGK
jgi:hypothetical protein